MPHFFILPEWVKNNRVTIYGNEVLHIVKVLRKKEGDLIEVFDGCGNEYRVRISSINRGKIKGERKILSLEGEIATKRHSEKEENVKIILYQSLVKNRKMEFIVQKCTEIGVYSIVPVFSERCVVKYEEKSLEKRIIRWQNIALQAAKQSLRKKIPKIEFPMRFSEALMKKGKGLKLIPWEGETKSLKSVLKDYRNMTCSFNQISEIYIFIGSEGGFSEREIKEASKQGVIPVTLGKRILRTETAGLVALSMIFYEYM